MDTEQLKDLVRKAEASGDRNFLVEGGALHRGMGALSPEDLDAFMEWMRVRRDAAGEALAKANAMGKVMREFAALMRPGETLGEAAHRLPPELLRDLETSLEQHYEAKALSETLR